MANNNSTRVTPNWNADDVAINYIYPTLDDVSVLIPGVTINPDVSIEVGGGNAFFYKDGNITVEDGAAGRNFNNAEGGNYRVDIPLNQSFQIDEKIPLVAVEAITPDVLGTKLVNATKAMANAWGRKGLIKMITGGAPLFVDASLTAELTASTIYGKIVDDVKTFDTKEGNLKKSEGANYLIVTPTALALLRKSTEFLQTSATAGVLKDGIVGTVAGLTVVLGRQLEAIANDAKAAASTVYATITDVYYILGSYDAFAAPVIFRNFRMKDSELFFGTRVQAEVPYGFEVIDSDRIFWRAKQVVLV